MNSVSKIRLVKGDTVQVLSGKFKGQSGKVLATHPRTGMVTVEGINIVKRAQKPTQETPQGGFVDKHKPLPVGKVAILNPTTKKVDRVAYEIKKDGTKVRVYAKTRKEIK